MNHRPFDDWLLADQPLTPQQKQELQAHLQNCPQCAALAEVNLALTSARAVPPQAGFADRFQMRLAARKRAMRTRNLWGFLILAVSVVSILAWLAWPVLKVVLRSPVDLLASWLSSLVSLWASLQAVGHVSAVLLRVAPGFIPASVWAAILLAAGGASLLWAFSLVKLTKNPQGV
ncbi:MAG: zf-HC2 domain-containing protein [Anaerolineales bacterium]|jgi:hypothetical protein